MNREQAIAAAEVFNSALASKKIGAFRTSEDGKEVIGVEKLSGGTLSMEVYYTPKELGARLQEEMRETDERS